MSVAAGASALAGQAHAFDATDLLAYKAGPLLIRPNMAVSERFDDNVRLQQDEFKSSDFITFFTPSLTLTLGRKDINNPYFNFGESEENYVSLNYIFNKYIYATHSDLSANDHTLSFSNRLKGNRLKLEGTDAMNILNSVLGQNYNLGRSVSRTTFGNNYRLTYEFSEKTSAYVVGDHSSVDWEEGTPLFDNNTLTGTLGGSYRLRPKTSLFSEVYYGQSAVNPSSDNVPKGPHETFVGGFIGARGQFTQKISGSVKAGYESREFSDNSQAGSSPVVDASVAYKFSEKTSTTLGYIRRSNVDLQSPGVNYDSDTVNWHVDQRFGNSDRLRAGLNIGYTRYSYGNSAAQFVGLRDRADDSLLAGLDVSYLIKVWLTASLGYDFESYSSSNNNVVDYTVNRVTLKLAVGY